VASFCWESIPIQRRTHRYGQHGRGFPLRQVLKNVSTKIYPPVRVTVSPVVENPTNPGNVIVVVRVDESKDAPHAVDSGRHVFVYERSDNKTDPIQLAKIDRIEHLLNRRRSIEHQRDESRSLALERAMNLIDRDAKPFVWASVVPLYPWRELCKWPKWNAQAF
jgi:hypothetical protein